MSEDLEAVVELDLFGGDGFGGAIVAEAGGGGGRLVGEVGDGGGGALLGAGFKVFAQGDEDDDGDGGVEFEVVGVDAYFPEKNQHGEDCGVDVGGAGAESDEEVHVGREAAQHAGGADEEGGAGVNQDGGGEHELQDGAGDEGVGGEEVHGPGHGQVGGEDGDAGGDAEPEAVGGAVGGEVGFLFDVFDGFGGEVFEDLGVVAGVFDGLEEGGGVGVSFDLGHVGGEVDGGAGDAGDGVEGFVDAGGAGAAVHAFDVEGGHGESVGSRVSPQIICMKRERGKSGGYADSPAWYKARMCKAET